MAKEEEKAAAEALAIAAKEADKAAAKAAEEAAKSKKATPAAAKKEGSYMGYRFKKGQKTVRGAGKLPAEFVSIEHLLSAVGSKDGGSHGGVFISQKQATDFLDWLIEIEYDLIEKA